MGDLSIRQLLVALEHSPFARDDPFVTQTAYLNKQKMDDLFNRTLNGISDIVRTVARSRVKEIEASAGVGVATPFKSFLLSLRASISGRLAAKESVETVIRTQLTDVQKFALAEVVLDDQALVTSDPGDVVVGAKPYARLCDVFEYFDPSMPEGGLKELLGDEKANAILARKKQDEAITGIPQWVFASGGPNAVATIFHSPFDDKAMRVGVVSQVSYFASRPAPGWSRTYFGAVTAPIGGVGMISLFYATDEFRRVHREG